MNTKNLMNAGPCLPLVSGDPDILDVGMTSVLFGVYYDPEKVLDTHLIVQRYGKKRYSAVINP